MAAATRDLPPNAMHDRSSKGAPSPDTTGGVAGDEDALFRTNPQVHANRHTGEDLLQPRPATAAFPAAFVSTRRRLPRPSRSADSPRFRPIHRASRTMAGIPMQSTPTHRIHSGRMRMPMTALMTAPMMKGISTTMSIAARCGVGKSLREAGQGSNWFWAP